jgi:hypothetical protein
VIELKIKPQTRKGFLIKVTTGHQTDTDRRLMAPRRVYLREPAVKEKKRYSIEVFMRLDRWGYDPLFVSVALEIRMGMAAAWMGSRGMQNASEARKAGGEAGKMPDKG